MTTVHLLPSHPLTSSLPPSSHPLLSPLSLFYLYLSSLLTFPPSPPSLTPHYPKQAHQSTSTAATTTSPEHYHCVLIPRVLTHVHDELSAGIDGAFVPTYHTQCHCIVGSLGNILHLLQRCVELGGARKACLLCAGLKVAKQELVLADPLYRFY